MLPISFGAIVLILCAAITTHLGLLPDLRAQLYKRAELMITTIRAASAINPRYQDLRLALEEITLQTSGVYGITLATLNPTIIWASSTHPDAEPDQHTADMLNFLDVSAEQHLFGEFIQGNGDVVVVAPLKRFIADAGHQITETEPLSLPAGVAVSSAYTLAGGDYEGILYLRFNWAEVEALAYKDLINDMLAITAAIVLMLVLSTVTVYQVILKPLNLIGRTIREQKSGMAEARTRQLTDDEIGVLGQSINEMLDAINSRDKLLKTVVNHLPVGFALNRIDGTNLIRNEAYKTSYLSAELDPSERQGVIDRQQTLQARVLASRRTIRYEEQLNFGAKNRHYEATLFPVFNSSDEIEWVGALCSDITEKKERELQLTQLYRAVESVKSGIVICAYDAPDFPIIYVNPAVTDLTGYTQAELIGQNPRIFGSGEGDALSLSKISLAIETRTPCTVVIQNVRKDGSTFWNEFTLSVITDNTGQATHLVGVQNDVTERITAARKIEHLAYFDPLTNIPNRNLFQDRLTQALAEASREARHVAILYVDLDGFKGANDTFGHNIGDLLLKEASKRMKQCIRDEDSLARMGGDEFTILIPNLSPEDEIVNLPKVVNRIREQLSTPFDIFKNIIHISGSVGISVYPRDGCSAEELLISADHAMYYAKESGKNTFRFFQPEMNRAIEQQQVLESSLREAVHSQAFTLHYQPQVNLKDGSVAVEALIRCQHPALCKSSPAVFIPVAEQCGLIDDIGCWVIQQACADLAEFIRDGSKINRVSVNISPHQFKRHNLTEIIRNSLQEHQLEASRLVVEITENVILDNYHSAREHLQELRALGVSIAIDDFGTGYSSLTYLKQLPIDTLKIDQQFVQGLPDNSDDVHIVKAIAGLASGMELTLLAEGAESEAQLAFIRDELDCYLVQGFIISRPLDVAGLKASGFYR
ncbi:EAL domain-containing protein [Aliamphritea hakodatensis]|uniref:EAL domain-containing protein n=1 Tax=Aliamphritea hakodatensis TaxID=2895352 RepID=UPI0022FD5534|nr:EAL domain-containing protein [Aliamphritea hakodatensis]